jgi:6-phosphofructokinase 1
MGRDSGFIAAGATLASQEVNFALVPSRRSSWKAERGLPAELHRRLLERHHALIVVAEGAGADLMPPTEERDAPRAT